MLEWNSDHALCRSLFKSYSSLSSGLFGFFAPLVSHIAVLLLHVIRGACQSQHWYLQKSALCPSKRSSFPSPDLILRNPRQIILCSHWERNICPVQWSLKMLHVMGLQRVCLCEVCVRVNVSLSTWPHSASKCFIQPVPSAVFGPRCVYIFSFALSLLY